MSLIRRASPRVHDATPGLEASWEERTTPKKPAVDARLSDADRRLDEIASRLNDVRQDTRVRVQPRFRFVQDERDAVRVALARGGRTRPDQSADPLDAAIDDIDIQIEIVSAQFELDDADSRTTFERSVARLLRAYRAHAELLEAATWATRPGETDQHAVAIRVGLERTEEQLRRYQDLSREVTGSLRAGVLAALDDLDSISRIPTTDDETEEADDR
jgi:hypothetical protein